MLKFPADVLEQIPQLSFIMLYSLCRALEVRLLRREQHYISYLHIWYMCEDVIDTLF